MFYYGIKCWKNQNLLFIHQLKTIDTLCGYICYIKALYKKNRNKTTKKGYRPNENILILYNLIDANGWHNLMFMTLHYLPPQSENNLYLNKIN